MEIALERMERLKISDGRTQPMGAVLSQSNVTQIRDEMRAHRPKEYEKLIS
jgi:hypothetical protein